MVRVVFEFKELRCASEASISDAWETAPVNAIAGYSPFIYPGALCIIVIA